MADTTSISYDAVLASTLYNYSSSFENNVFQSRPFLNWLKSKGRIKTYTGGAKIVTQIMDGSNDTAGFYSGYDTIPTTPQDGVDAAEWDWGQAAVSIAISGIEEAKNSGREAIVDLLEAKIMQAEESLADLLTKSLFSVTGPTGAYNGVGALVDSTGTVGGLDPSVHANWASYEDSVAAPLTIGYMSAAWDGTSQGGNDTPDFIITTQTLWEKYESLLQPQLRYSDPGTADAGFVNLLYRGAPVTWDYACARAATGYTFDTTPMYFLNSKHLWIARHSDVWFKTTPFKQPTNQDARYAQILAYGQLVTNCRRRLGKLTAKTA